MANRMRLVIGCKDCPFREYIEDLDDSHHWCNLIDEKIESFLVLENKVHENCHLKEGEVTVILTKK